MKHSTEISSVFLAIRCGGVLVLLAMVYLLLSADVKEVSSQQSPEKSSMQQTKEEKEWVKILADGEALKVSPEKVLKAIDELGNIAQLRGISSDDTMSVLANYLDLPRDLLIAREQDTLGQTGIIYEPHPRMPETRFPAVVTFQKIGKSAIPVLLGVIEKNKVDSLKSKNAVFLLKYYFREDLDRGAERIKEAAERSETDEGRGRLQKASLNLLRKDRQ